MLPLILLAISFYKPLQQNYFSSATHTVTGWITDEQGTAIPYCSIIEKGSKQGVTSDNNGYYSIKVSGTNAVLQFSMVGYSTVDVKVKGQSQVNVKMSNNKDEEADVVVTSAYNVKRKKLSDKSAIANSLPSISNVHFNRQNPNDIASNTEDNDIASNTEDYDHIQENIFLKATDNPLSTFSIDVDAASYSNVRRILKQGQLPVAGAVRIEEMINYFNYNYPQPTGDAPPATNRRCTIFFYNRNERCTLECKS